MPFDERGPRRQLPGETHQPKAMCPRCGYERGVRQDGVDKVCADCKWVLRLDPIGAVRWGIEVDWDKVDWDWIEAELAKADRDD